MTLTVFHRNLELLVAALTLSRPIGKGCAVYMFRFPSQPGCRSPNICILKCLTMVSTTSLQRKASSYGEQENPAMILGNLKFFFLYFLKRTGQEKQQHTRTYPSQQQKPRAKVTSRLRHLIFNIKVSTGIIGVQTLTTISRNMLNIASGIQITV